MAVSFEPDADEEVRAPVVDIAKSIPEGGTKIIKTSDQLRAAEQKVDGDKMKGIEQNPKEMMFPINATVKWEMERKPQSPPKNSTGESESADKALWG